MNVTGDKSGNYLYSGDSVKKGNNIDISQEFSGLVNDVHMLPGKNISVLYQIEEVVFQGLKYKPDVALLLKWRMNILLFAMIVGLYIHDYKKIAICNKLQTEEFEWKCICLQSHPNK